jgi:hypothetical protein
MYFSRNEITNMSTIVHTVHKYIRFQPVEQLTGKYIPFTGKTCKAHKWVHLTTLLRECNKKCTNTTDITTINFF